MVSDGQETEVREIHQALLELLGGEERLVRIWLEAPHPSLDGDTPQAVIEAGEAWAVLTLVRTIEQGGPA